MVMKKLKIEHLAPYIPYNVSYAFRCALDHNNDYEEILSYKDTDEIGCVLNYSEYFLLLRPLSDLTKEIKVNGKGLIPIAKLHYKSYRMRGTRARVEPTVSTYSREQILSTKKFDSQLGIDIYLEQMNRNFYWINRQLFEWHFDIFGLIEEGLAIDMNKL